MMGFTPQKSYTFIMKIPLFNDLMRFEQIEVLRFGYF